MKAVALAVLILLLLTPAARGEIGYTVKPDETIEGIAAKFHIDIDILLDENGLEDGSEIYEGLRLIIPYITEDDDESDNDMVLSVRMEYEIKKGDYLERIARKFNCTVDDLLRLNGLKRTSILQIGDVIEVPQSDPIPIIESEESKDQKDVEQSEDVKQSRYKKDVEVDVSAENATGKNLLDLSQLDDAEVVIKENGHDSDNEDIIDVEKTDEEVKITVIKKQLELPGKSDSDKPAGYLLHEIEKGDSVSKLANKYRVSESSIFKMNNISKRSVLRIGRQIKIPVKSDANLSNINVKKAERIKEPVASRSLTKYDKIVRKALEYKGVKYVYGGTNLSKGVDCSGYVMKVFEQFGVNLPHSSKAQSKIGMKVEFENLQPGDLVFFRTSGRGISHVGIYIGDGKLIHASTTSRRVQVDDLSSHYFKSNFVSARRIL